MIVLGIILLVVGIVLPIHILFIIGLVLLCIGVGLMLLSVTGRPVGGRHWY